MYWGSYKVRRVISTRCGRGIAWRTALLFGFALALIPRLGAEEGGPAAALPADAATPAGAARSAPPILDDDPAALLGLALGEAFGRFGPPASAIAVRGEEAWQDDVAFRYAPGYTLFIFGDRLWQLGFAAPYSGSIFGLFIGDEADKAYSILGEPHERGEAALVYRMPYRGFPVRLRLVLAGTKIAEAYLYRADY